MDEREQRAPTMSLKKAHVGAHMGSEREVHSMCNKWRTVIHFADVAYAGMCSHCRTTPTAVRRIHSIVLCSVAKLDLNQIEFFH